MASQILMSVTASALVNKSAIILWDLSLVIAEKDIHYKMPRRYVKVSIVCKLWLETISFSLMPDGLHTSNICHIPC